MNQHEKQLAELRKKKPPPVPKFEPTQESKTQLREKMGQLYSKLNASSVTEEQPITLGKFNQPVQTAAKPAEPDKKKMSLSNINEKLASMMNLKKDLLKSKTEPKEQKKEEPKNEQSVLPSGRRVNLEEEYDPNYPNNYDLVKAYYEEPAEPSKQAAAPPTAQPTEMQIEAEQDHTVGLSETEEKALKMMQKYGYKVGDGLGKNKQGITTPLTIKKTTESSCIIMPSSIPMNYVVPKDVSARTALESFHIDLSPVIVLNNILTIDQLNEQHEAAIKQELEKYGKVLDMMVYLLGRELRIFIRFQSQEQALRAFTDLNQKFYQGNFVSVRFYNEQAFSSFKLDEPMHDHVNC